MNKRTILRYVRVYELLLRLYPKSYRDEFGEEMKYVFSQSLQDAYREKGEFGIVGCLRKTIVDVVKSVFVEHKEHLRGGEKMKKNHDLIMQNKIFGYIGLATLVLLSVPFFLMQVTSEVAWDFVDFVVMGMLVFGVAFLFVAVARVIPKKYRLLAGIVLLIGFLLVWAHLAVGIVNTWPLAGS